ncbi:MAG: prepilin peptidase, partial [Candidatus Pacebacteria bacterium]|nr:prepilin peptidase [Candidatus Paceibacterota bacterium]
MFLFFFIIFILGLAIGSFLNVIIFRLESGEKIINDRSKCMNCRHVLEWHDLIPVLSFVFLKGRCRYCGNKISWQYPFVEIATGILFIIVSSIQY